MPIMTSVSERSLLVCHREIPPQEGSPAPLPSASSVGGVWNASAYYWFWFWTNQWNCCWWITRLISLGTARFMLANKQRCYQKCIVWRLRNWRAGSSIRTSKTGTKMVRVLMYTLSFKRTQCGPLGSLEEFRGVLFQSDVLTQHGLITMIISVHNVWCPDGLSEIPAKQDLLICWFLGLWQMPVSFCRASG